MKKIYAIIGFLFTLISAAQTNDIGKISLSVVMPDYIAGLNEEQLAKLDTKITQVVTASGISDSGYGSNIVIYPKIGIGEVNVVEGGMQNITQVTLDLALFVKQTESNIMFSSVSKTLKGSGSSKELAISNAIGKISPKDPDYVTFIEKSKSKITQYFESKCGDIIKRSDVLVQTQQFEEALGLLMSVPDAASCHDQVQQKAVAVFKEFQKKNCTKQIQLAKNALASKDYAQTLDVLSEIDPSAPCYKESQDVVRSIESKISAEEKKQWDFQMKQYNDAVSLEKQRINAIKDVAVAYYKSQTYDVNYTVIVK